MDYHILPLFSSPVVTTTITEDMSALKRIASFEHNNAATKSKAVLECFPREKQIFKEIFHGYTKSFLHFDNIEFEISTSWGTKIDPGNYCEGHTHGNCMYSSVFYPHDTTEKSGGELQFDTTFWSCYLLDDPSEYNVYNSRSWCVTPHKNLFVIFPSHLKHSILRNTGNETRYSLAMNWVPVGSYGLGDSSINMSITPVKELFQNGNRIYT